MISYTTFFNQILKQYIAKRQNDPHFFNGRIDQEAMGFMVAVNTFREELAHPTTKKITDKPTIQKNLPTISGSYGEAEIGKWLYDIELVARAQAQKLGNSKLSNEDIASQIFRSKFVPPENLLLEIWDIVLILISSFFVFYTIYEYGFPTFIKIYFFYTPKDAQSLLTLPWITYAVISVFFWLGFWFCSKIPINAVKKFFSSENQRYFLVLLFISYIYIVSFYTFTDKKIKFMLLLSITALLVTVITSLFINTSLPAGYYDLNTRQVKIFLSISSAELLFTSAILLQDSILIYLYENKYIFIIWMFSILSLALFIATKGSKLFDQFISQI